MEPLVARLPRTTVPAVALPVLWTLLAGTVWQALQRTGFERVPSTCAAWAPTPEVVTAVLP